MASVVSLERLSVSRRFSRVEPVIFKTGLEPVSERVAVVDARRAATLMVSEYPEAVERVSSSSEVDDEVVELMTNPPLARFARDSGTTSEEVIVNLPQVAPWSWCLALIASARESKVA